MCGSNAVSGLALAVFSVPMRLTPSACRPNDGEVECDEDNAYVERIQSV